ncbi:corticotropin-releasing factor receptor 1-like [Sinocyclocheilus grahami]|uniref:corticotropin-releasing factor receptor 1-like n=1 Tax=Sinocyclocheilus grahami TaxID=75366 RepID=UPI0007ACEB65|nr:PREDICTED: corticotropin-releasing factor receptor 1-like [Sinocyclocheilus grahami]
MSRIPYPQVLTIWITLISRVTADLTCDALLLLSTNLTARTLILWNQTSSPTNFTGLSCNTSIDGIGTCWPRSSAGEVVSRPCPETFLGVRYNTTNNVYRECLANGTWAKKGNYSQCQEILNEEKKSKLHYHIAVIINYLGHCISLGALLVAFILFMRLRWIWCRLVTAAYNYFHVTNFFWMFGEGCYLHTAIVLTYSTDKLRKWMFICIGWCIPFPIIVAWAIGKLYYDNEKCWFGKRAGIYTDYIYQGPMILVLLINFIFLFNIVRILMTKLRASTTSETIQYRKAVKATLVLLPLLGITYMLFFVNPGEDEISQIVFIYFNSFLESFQTRLLFLSLGCYHHLYISDSHRKAVKATLVLLPLLGITYMLFFVNPGEDEISQIVFIYFNSFLESFQVRSAVRKRWHRWQDKHSIRARVARAMSIPTSPTRVSFHSIKQSSAV